MDGWDRTHVDNSKDVIVMRSGSLISTEQWSYMLAYSYKSLPAGLKTRQLSHTNRTSYEKSIDRGRTHQ